MKKLLVAAAALATVMLSGQAQAADIGYRQYAPPPAPVPRWTGPYFGANVGYAWGDVTNSGTSPSGVAGGLQAGYSWQSGPLVFGVEGDLQASGADDTFASWKFSNPWFGTARGRIGYALNNILLYATGGLAFGSVKAETFGVLGRALDVLGAGNTALRQQALQLGEIRSRERLVRSQLGDCDMVEVLP